MTPAKANPTDDRGLVVGIDRDPAAIDRLSEQLKGLPVAVACASYTETPNILEQLSVKKVDAILLDLGLSSDQLADASRGFSFQHDGPLDLRFNPLEGEPAWRLVQRLSAERLADLIYEFGEERHSRRIARAIVRARTEQPIRTAAALAAIVRRAVPGPRGGSRHQGPRIDPATRTFQALRIAVNRELEQLDTALQRLPSLLLDGGRLAIISFHSLEDRRVKRAFLDDPRLELVTKKPVTASPAEIAKNPRSRSAKLRVSRRTTDAKPPPAEKQ